MFNMRSYYIDEAIYWQHKAAADHKRMVIHRDFGNRGFASEWMRISRDASETAREYLIKAMETK